MQQSVSTVLMMVGRKEITKYMVKICNFTTQNTEVDFQNTVNENTNVSSALLAFVSYLTFRTSDFKNKKKYCPSILKLESETKNLLGASCNYFVFLNPHFSISFDGSVRQIVYLRQER